LGDPQYLMGWIPLAEYEGIPVCGALELKSQLLLSNKATTAKGWSADPDVPGYNNIDIGTHVYCETDWRPKKTGTRRPKLDTGLSLWVPVSFDTSAQRVLL
jgi:hypothetical protein